MAQIKHRPFNADRFLDKFKGSEAVLTAYLDKWSGQIPGFSEEFNIEGFKDFLKYPPDNCRPFQEMVEGLYRTWDLCKPHGEEFMREAVERNHSPLQSVHDIPREVFAVRLITEDPVSFELAENLNYAQQVDRFVTFRGREPRSISDVSETIEMFKVQLQAFFQERKGSDKVLVKHFTDGDVLNFIIYHEERVKAEIELQKDGTTLTVQPLIFRPARQDFVSYFPESGKIQIDNPSDKEREAIRKSFSEVCLGDPDFFEEEGSDAQVDLSVFGRADFQFSLDEGDVAYLTEIAYKLPQRETPTITVRSRNVFESLRVNGMSRHLEAATIEIAKVKIILAGNKRGKTVTLRSPNRLSFNRATQAERVMEYLTRWELLQD